MKLPVIEGIIRRRILVNFRVDPAVMQKQLPPEFQPKLHHGFAIAGICLIRLEQIRPKGLPAFFGLSSENAAHRIAVTWRGEDGLAQEGVYIPRRDTGSRLNQLAGGRLFPGQHSLADFRVRGGRDEIDLSMSSTDGEVVVRVRGTVANEWPRGSTFGGLEEASAFFEPGALGYSVTREPGKLEGLSLRTREWKVEALNVADVYSSYFADTSKFPEGSVHFDCALIMRDVAHEWHSAAAMKLAAAV